MSYLFVCERVASLCRRPVKYKGTTATLKTKIIKRHREKRGKLWCRKQRATAFFLPPPPFQRWSNRLTKSFTKMGQNDRIGEFLQMTRNQSLSRARSYMHRNVFTFSLKNSMHPWRAAGQIWQVSCITALL